MINDINSKFSTKEEAQRVADIENMGRDYSTAVVEFDGENWIIKIV